jgi:hypothetical protein
MSKPVYTALQIRTAINDLLNKMAEHGDLQDMEVIGALNDLLHWVEYKRCSRWAQEEAELAAKAQQEEK